MWKSVIYSIVEDLAVSPRKESAHALRNYTCGLLDALNYAQLYEEAHEVEIFRKNLKYWFWPEDYGVRAEEAGYAKDQVLIQAASWAGRTVEVAATR